MDCSKEDQNRVEEELVQQGEEGYGIGIRVAKIEVASSGGKGIGREWIQMEKRRVEFDNFEYE